MNSLLIGHLKYRTLDFDGQRGAELARHGMLNIDKFVNTDAEPAWRGHRSFTRVLVNLPIVFGGSPLCIAELRNDNVQKPSFLSENHRVNARSRS